MKPIVSPESGHWLKDLLTSVELWAAFFGALAAFLLEALRRGLVDRSRKLAAGNEAVFALAQMHTLARLIYNQSFLDREAFIQKEGGRSPHYFEYLPMALPENAVVRLPIDRLGWALASYHPDILNRLAAMDRAFASVILSVTERNAEQREFHRRLMALPVAEVQRPLELTEKMIGLDLCFTLRQSTEALRGDLPRFAEHVCAVGRELTKMLSYHFPISRITTFNPIERTKAADRPDVKAPLWRRAVRGLVTRLRHPTGVPPTA